MSGGRGIYEPQYRDSSQYAHFVFRDFGLWEEDGCTSPSAKSRNDFGRFGNRKTPGVAFQRGPSSSVGPRHRKELGTQLTLADRHGLAILSLSSTNPWSEDLADLETKSFEGLLRALKSSPQLTEVRLLPSLLVPQKRTVPYLREAAARFQADLLFVYTARIQTFRKSAS
jgi:hypothetical protein